MKYNKYGLIMFIFGGFLYTLERISAKLAAYISTIGSNGSFDATPTYPSVFDNLFVPLSLIISVVFMILAMLNKNK